MSGYIDAGLSVITAKSRFMPGMYVWFGQPNMVPDPDNPLTLKTPYLDAEMTIPANPIQGIDSDSKFEQSITGRLYGDGQYSIRLMTGPSSNATQIYYIPSVETVGTAAYRNVATNAQALAGTAGVLPDAEQVRRNHVAQVATLADLRALEPAFDGQQVELLGHTVAGVGGGMFYADYSSSAADDNGVTVVTPGGRRWVRKKQLVSNASYGEGGGYLLDPDAISSSMSACVRNELLDGLLVSSKTLVGGAEHFFDFSGKAYKPVDDEAIILSEFGQADIPRLTGQIAQNVETFVTDGDRVYALIKGSYSLNDSSLLASFQITKNGVSNLLNVVDLGTGANCRAMAMANGFLYVFKDSTLLIFKTEEYAPPALIQEITRPATGFVQACSIINGLLVAPVWGDDRIETYSINQNGYPVLHENYTVTAGSSNASVVDANDGSFLLIRHVSGTDALGRFHFDGEKRIVDMQFYSIPEMLQCRYGVVRNSFLYTGSFSTGDLLEIPLAPENIAGFAPSRTFDNMSSFIVYDNYIIGADTATGTNSAVNLDSGVTYALESGLTWLYPQVYGDTFITFINGDEPDEPGATPNDSPMGQKLAVYKLRNNAALNYPKNPVVPSFKSVSTVYNTESSYEIFGLASGYNAMGDIKQLDSLFYAWAELKFSGFVVDNQASGVSAYKVFEGRALLLYFGGSWEVKEAYTDDIAKGASAVTVALSTGIMVGFGVNSGAALSNAIVRMKVELRSQSYGVLSL